MNKTDRYLDNLKEPALRQIIKFLLDTDSHEHMELNRDYILKQIDEFHRMYPGDVGDLTIESMEE